MWLKCMKTCLFYALFLLALCLSPHFFISYLYISGERGDKHCIAFFYDAFRTFFHTLYEIFVLCIIYCMPQNSGGKCVLTENIVKMQKIYGAIENRKNYGEKIMRSIRDIFFCCFPTGPFHFLNSICFPEKKKFEAKSKNKIYEHARAKSWERKQKYCIRGLIWFKKNFQEKKNERKNKKTISICKNCTSKQNRISANDIKKVEQEEEIFLCI